MEYGFICDHANDYPVKLLCRMLSVQRSAYYEWRTGPCKVIGPEELALRRRMKELFAASRDSLGSRTMMNNLREEGFDIGPRQDTSFDESAAAQGETEAQVQSDDRQQAQAASGAERVEPGFLAIGTEPSLGRGNEPPLLLIRNSSDNELNFMLYCCLLIGRSKTELSLGI